MDGPRVDYGRRKRQRSKSWKGSGWLFVFLADVPLWPSLDGRFCSPKFLVTAAGLCLKRLSAKKGKLVLCNWIVSILQVEAREVEGSTSVTKLAASTAASQGAQTVWVAQWQSRDELASWRRPAPTLRWQCRSISKGYIACSMLEGRGVREPGNQGPSRDPARGQHPYRWR